MTTIAAAGRPSRDDFNWPALNRKDLLSHTGGLSKDMDGFDTRTVNFRNRYRVTSANLTTNDIDGKLQLPRHLNQELAPRFGFVKTSTGLNLPTKTTIFMGPVPDSCMSASKSPNIT